ncbi:hypothetical protein BpHYR1_040194, partial [Brachionus plicatilis]
LKNRKSGHFDRLAFLVLINFLNKLVNNKINIEIIQTWFENIGDELDSVDIQLREIIKEKSKYDLFFNLKSVTLDQLYLKIAKKKLYLKLETIKYLQIYCRVLQNQYISGTEDVLVATIYRKCFVKTLYKSKNRKRKFFKIDLEIKKNDCIYLMNSSEAVLIS